MVWLGISIIIAAIIIYQGLDELTNAIANKRNTKNIEKR